MRAPGVSRRYFNPDPTATVKSRAAAPQPPEQGGDAGGSGRFDHAFLGDQRSHQLSRRHVEGRIAYRDVGRGPALIGESAYLGAVALFDRYVLAAHQSSVDGR